jgi:hypothetical protein
MDIVKVLMVIVMLFLFGCVSTPAERAAKQQQEVEQMIEVYGPACEKLGYKQDSDEWRGCVLHLAAQDDYKRYSEYNDRPRFTHCFAHKGFYNCTTF